MNQTNTMSILLTTNEAYAQHAAVCIKSVIINNPNTQLYFIVASLKLQQATKMKLSQLTECSPLIDIDIVDFDHNKLEILPQIGNYTKDIYLRLWVDELFEKTSPDKVLYLDADTIVVDSLNELWNMPLGDNLIAAVDIPNSTSHERCHLPKEKGYFNSGVLLFNVKLWRKENCLAQISAFLEENKAIALNPDQDALNGLYHDRRITLPSIYNAITPFFKQKNQLNLEKTKLADIQKNVVIIHFNGAARPWFLSCAHPYQQRYFDYLKQTPWHDFECTDKGFFTLFKKYLRRLIGIENFVKIKNLKGMDTDGK
jgi:lipopolysaccharide biosynthesis glycosyltransferase